MEAIVTPLYIEDETVKISLENQIIHYNYKVSVVDLEIQKKNIKDRLYFSGEIPRPIFIDSTFVKYWTQDARDYTLRPEHLKLVKALAFYYTSHVHKVILNWVRTTIPPSIPMEIFASKEEALEWLEQYR